VSWWPTVRLVAAREIRTRATSKATRIVTVIMVVAIVALTVILDVTRGGDSAQKVGLTSATAQLAQPLRQAAQTTGQDVDVSTVSSPAAGAQDVRDGHLDALLGRGGPGKPFTVVVKDDLDDNLHATLNQLARQESLNRQITRLGGDPAQVSTDMARATPRVTELEPQEPFHSERLVIGVIVGILIYVGLLSYGQAVAQGVVEEKTSRVVEILLSTIRAWQLMAGKVLGIGVVGLAQLAIILGAGALTAAATGVLSLPTSVAAGTIVWAIVWYLLGYFLYALLFAAAGALVSRQEDVGSVTMPLMMLIIVPYVIGISALPADPENGLVRTLSLIPLFSPMLMPMREAMGVATAGELIFSVALTAALVAALVRVTGRIYSNAVMRMGARIRVGDAFRGT
jgi:ABC-2 type transport system permease protein